MEIYIHMKGGNIGTINIYQAPVEGFAVKKFSLSTHQGSEWFKRQIQFDSDKEFQVCMMTWLKEKIQSNPVNKDTKEAIESVRINGMFVYSGEFTGTLLPLP